MIQTDLSTSDSLQVKIPAKLLIQFYLLDARLAVLDRTEMADTNRTHSKLVTRLKKSKKC